jgi:hypothetical protein
VFHRIDPRTSAAIVMRRLEALSDEAFDIVSFEEAVIADDSAAGEPTSGVAVRMARRPRS